MNLHAIIIKLLLNNIYYTKYYNLVLNKYNSNKHMYKLLLVINSLYSKYNKDKYTIEELEVAFNAAYPAMQQDEAGYYLQFFETLLKTEVDERIADDMFASFSKMQLAEEIALMAVQVAQGKQDFEKLNTLVSTIDNTEKEDVEQLVTTSITEIHNAKANQPGLTWRCTSLNKALGPLRQGNFGFIFARPETGKTTFLASEVTFMGDQVDGNILWVNNEQPGTDVVWRCYNAFLGASNNDLLSDLQRAEKAWNDSIGGKLKFIDNPGITKTQLEAICKKYEPKLIVFDQLDKVYGFDAERYDLVLKAKYQWARELSKKYGPVIGVCQAGGTAENKRYLDMTDVDSSYTAKQGEADWIIGIGKINDAGFERLRYFSICKNKLPAADGMEPGLRHGKFEMLINEEIARYEDKIRW